MERGPLAGWMCCMLLLALVPGPARSAPAPPDTALVHGSNAFAFELYARLARQDGNVCFSPLSVHSALAMAYTGARGATATAVGRALHVGDAPDAVGKPYRRLLEALRPGSGGKGSTLEIANALWSSERVRLEPAFVSALEKDFEAPARSLDFGNAAQAAGTINDWVATQTHQRIRELVTPSALNAASSCVLTNAVYFRGDWMTPFHKSATRHETFHRTDADTVRVPTMQQTGRMAIAEMPGAQVLSLPYADGRLSMLVLLPRHKDGLHGLERALSERNVAGWIGKLRPHLVELHLPRFTFSHAEEMKAPLTALGMGVAFDPAQADFSGISRGSRTRISAVLHRAYIAVDEAGTEAAAATGTVMELTAARPTKAERPIVFRADHPFVFVLRDERTGAILFVGRVADPA